MGFRYIGDSKITSQSTQSRQSRKEMQFPLTLQRKKSSRFNAAETMGLKLVNVITCTLESPVVCWFCLLQGSAVSRSFRRVELGIATGLNLRSRPKTGIEPSPNRRLPGGKGLGRLNPRTNGSTGEKPAIQSVINWVKRLSVVNHCILITKII